MTVRPPHPQNIATTLPTVKMVVEVSKAVAVLSTSLIVKMMKSKVMTLSSDVPVLTLFNLFGGMRGCLRIYTLGKIK